MALGVAYEKAFDQAAVKAGRPGGRHDQAYQRPDRVYRAGPVPDMAEICRPESTGPLAQAWTWLKDGIGAVVEYFR